MTSIGNLIISGVIWEYTVWIELGEVYITNDNYDSKVFFSLREFFKYEDMLISSGSQENTHVFLCA